MKSLLIAFLAITYAFSLTPYSLEGLKEFNVKIWNKNNLLTKEQSEKLKIDIEKKLEPLKLQLHTKTFSNLLVKLESVEVGETTVVNVTLAIIEDAHPARDKKMVNMTITYMNNDMFDTTDVQTDVFDSVLSFLLEDFIEQYKNEN